MTKEKRIEIINRQIIKLDEVDFQSSTWNAETGNLLNYIFHDSEGRREQLKSMLRQAGSGALGIDTKKLKQDWKTLLKGYIFEIELQCDESTNNDSASSKQDLSKVFIVHGHNNSVKLEVARFIEKLGLEPVILHEQASSGKTIIEKIESYSNVGFGVVLYTACDSGSKKGDESNFKDRARQNVVFEHGFLMGKIGRKNVCALVEGEIETPNDISGVVYISLQDNWQVNLVKEMRNSGYNVDMSKL